MRVVQNSNVRTARTRSNVLTTSLTYIGELAIVAVAHFTHIFLNNLVFPILYFPNKSTYWEKRRDYGEIMYLKIA